MPENKPTTRRTQPGRGAAAAEQRRQAARRRDARRRMAAVAVAAVAVLAVVIVALARSSDDGSGDRPGGEAAAPTGTKSFEDLAREHVPGSVSYPQTPPVGGNHNRVWQDCGFYPEPITTEQGVHTMEHGAVWVTYRPDLPAEQVTALQRMAEGQTYILVSAWRDGLPAPVVASAWGRQLTLPSASDPTLADFVRAFRQGPQTPEPGAPCTGGESSMR